MRQGRERQQGPSPGLRRECGPRHLTCSLRPQDPEGRKALDAHSTPSTPDLDPLWAVPLTVRLCPPSGRVAQRSSRSGRMEEAPHTGEAAPLTLFSVHPSLQEASTLGLTSSPSAQSPTGREEEQARTVRVSPAPSSQCLDSGVENMAACLPGQDPPSQGSWL